MGEQIVLLVGYTIYHKIALPDVPLLVPLLEADFETGAVWGRGGGVLMREQEKRERETLGKKGWNFKRALQAFS